MRPLKVSELPAHPELTVKQSNAPEVRTFVSDALEEGNKFMISYMPSKFALKDANKKSSPATADVKLTTHELQVRDLPREVQGSGAGNESWFARTSIHDNKAEEGTASWDEFDNGLRVDHSQHEKDYTPGVLDAHEVMNWDESLGGIERKIGDWHDVHVSVMEMCHKIPPPLNNRVFTVLVITAKREREFIVVQIPVSPEGLPNAKYHNAAKITPGMYVSVERGELLEEGKKVKWQMATASDAGGSLPMWMQKMGVPGAVVKDVGLFIGWCDEKRKGKK